MIDLAADAQLPHPRFGIDYAWGTPNPSAFRSIGVTFAWRYHSDDPSKNLTLGEARELQAAGIDVVTGWESSATRPLAGFDAGRRDAQVCVEQSAACGRTRPPRHVFAFDDDPAAHNLNDLLPYYEGAATVIPKRDCGCYGGYSLVAFLIGHGFGYHFQTYAWSHGLRHPAAQLYQYSNSHNVGGVDTDFDLAFTVDFGQFSYTPTPIPTPPKGAQVINVVKLNDGRLEVFAEDKDTGEVFHTWQNREGGGWMGAKAGHRNAGWSSMGKPADNRA